jgi:hypothetical protein
MNGKQGKQPIKCKHSSKCKATIRGIMRIRQTFPSTGNNMADRTAEERIDIEVDYYRLKNFVTEAERLNIDPSYLLNWFITKYVLVPDNNVMDLSFRPNNP